MINTVSDFLVQFKAYALSQIELNDKDVKHTVAIGDNFEGLTAELLDKALFKGLNLKIVERSFIYNDTGVMSDEMDCLLVVGEGQKMTYTNRYKYHFKDVIAVFQVKKNLHAKDIDDAHNNLLSILDVYEPVSMENYEYEMFRSAYKLLTSKELPAEERQKRFTDRENLLYYYLLREAVTPPRIVIGYYGYTTEYGLRKGFFEKLERNLEKDSLVGYGPITFPNLYICGNSSIVKNNGMPMGTPLSSDEYYFPILSSSTGKPMYELLQLIWTRLVYRFELGPGVFGDDFHIDSAHGFLSCKERKIGNEWGWEMLYHGATHAELSEPLVSQDWNPVEIDGCKFSILQALVDKGSIDITDEAFLRHISNQGLKADTVIKDMLESKLVYVDEGRMGLLVEELNTYWAPDGKVYAGENKSGEMVNYFQKLTGKLIK